MIEKQFNINRCTHIQLIEINDHPQDAKKAAKDRDNNAKEFNLKTAIT